MTNPLYASLQTLANNQLNSFGQGCVLRRRTEALYDPMTAQTLGPAVTDYPIRAVVSPYSDRNVDGSLIKAGDLQAFIPSKNLIVVPEASDHFVVAGVEFSIIKVDQTNPGGTSLLYTLQLRRGP